MMKRLLMTCTLAAFAANAGADLLPANIDLADGPGNLGTRATQFTAPASNAASASNQSVAYGDFNRDGFDDMVVGYAASDFGGTDAGTVYVIFGKADFPAEQNAATNPVTFLYCQDAAAQFGYSVATGDLDGDGRDELLVGAPGFNSGNGAVAIFNGTTLVANGSLAVGFAATDPSGTEMRVLGTEEGAQLGYSITTGNLDQDDRWDIAIGEPYADSGAKVDTGKTYVWYGDDYAPSTKVNATAINNRWMISGAEGDNLGTAMTFVAGDNDGLDNLAIGAAGFGSSAKVYVMAVLSPATTDYALDDANNLLNNGHAVIDGVPGLGFSLAAGAVTFDSREGLLMGAPLHDRDGLTNSGAVVFLQDLQAIFGMVTTLDISNTIPGVLIFLGANDGGLLGGSVAFSDLNGDGLPDVVLGEPAAPGADSQAQAGRVHVRYSQDVFLAGSTFDLGEAALDSTITGEAALGYLGASLAGNGDADGDGLADLFALAPFAVQGAEGLGNAYLIYGERSGDPNSQVAATARLNASPGDTSTYGFGGRLSPVLRAKVKYSGGSVAPVGAEVYPGTPAQGLTGDGDEDTDGINTAKVYWSFLTDRTNITSTEVTINYTDAEIAGFDENFLGVYLTETCGPPWNRVQTQTHDPASNEFKVTLPGQLTSFCLGIAFEAPIITLLGNEGITLGCGFDTFVDPGAEAQSPVDGDISQNIVVSGTVDESTPGSYPITYNVTDSTGAAAVEVTRTITVEDITAPTITLTPGPQVVCGDVYVEPGFTATDVCDGDLTDQVVIGGDTLDTSTEGTYIIEYAVTDSSGNTEIKNRNILVQAPSPPPLTLTGGESIIWECGVPWVDPGVTSIDGCGNDLTANISILNPQPPAIPTGDFNVNYSVTDGFSTRTATRTVNVVDSLPPVVTLVGDAAVTIPCDLPYNDAGANLIDLCEGNITIARLQVQSDVDTSTPGVYEVTYFGFDGSFNQAVGVTRTVTVACPQDEAHTVDQDGNFVISLSELLRPIQFYNAGGLHCADNPNDTEDGFVPGPGANQTCDPYASDYNPQNWIISLSELLRAIQFYNTGAYHPCPGENTEDGYCPGTP